MIAGGQPLGTGRFLPYLGAAALIVAGFAVLRGGGWALLAAAAGAAAAVAWQRWSRPRPVAGTGPLDFTDSIDWLRRGYAARAAWLIGLPDGDVEVVDREAELVREARDRGAALARLASVDGRSHIVSDVAGTFVALGDFPFGACLLLAPPGAVLPPERGAEVAEELRRLLAALRVAERDEPVELGPLIARRLARAAAGAHTLEGIARAGAALAEQLTHRPAAIVVQGRIIAVSSTADRRLTDQVLADSSPVARAMQSGLPVVTGGNEDIFGAGMPERRRRDRAGAAYPLTDGHFVVGALVLIGPSAAADSALSEHLGRLVMELGPRLAAARAVHEAEQRAVRDPLTGLPNRREFERVLEAYQAKDPATLVYADLDRFKQLNDSLGHAAGDAALKHIADVLRAQIRDGDMAARIGGEEFAIWLPATPLTEGVEVAERIRQAVAASVWRWSGTPYPLTTSCGVANYPVTVSDVNNLRVAADAALYKAKQAGRNRVEKAGRGD